MNNMYDSSKQGYSSLIAITMIGFLFIMVVGVFHLVLRDLGDNRGIGNALKAYFGAEAAQELALLSIKRNGYGFVDSIDHSVNERSIMLARNPLEIEQFSGSDVFFSYNLGSNTSSHTGTLEGLEYDIIPLFYLDGDAQEIKATDIRFEIVSGDAEDLSWNIVSDLSGVSGSGSFRTTSSVKEKKVSGSGLEFIDTTVENFLTSSSNNYLILFYAKKTNVPLIYNLRAYSGGVFSVPRTRILSSAQVGSYRQNLSTSLDNTQYLDFLKYSIYSIK